MDMYSIRNMLVQGKSIYDLPLRVSFYARVSTDRYEQLNSLENQVMYFENFIKEQENCIRRHFKTLGEAAKSGVFSLLVFGYVMQQFLDFLSHFAGVVAFAVEPDEGKCHLLWSFLCMERID